MVITAGPPDGPEAGQAGIVAGLDASVNGGEYGPVHIARRPSPRRSETASGRGSFPITQRPVRQSLHITALRGGTVTSLLPMGKPGGGRCSADRIHACPRCVLHRNFQKNTKARPPAGSAPSPFGKNRINTAPNVPSDAACGKKTFFLAHTHTGLSTSERYIFRYAPA